MEKETDYRRFAMDNTYETSLAKLHDLIDSIIKGRIKEETHDLSTFSPQLLPLAEKLIQLKHDLRELRDFTRSLTKGNIDINPPGRANILAADIKELHSQLASLKWSIGELMKGNMVAKLYYPGEMYETYNALVEKLARTFGENTSGTNAPRWGNEITSWRYHQILNAMNNLNIFIIEVDATGKILFANPPAKELLDHAERIPYDDLHAENLIMEYLCGFKGKAGRKARGNHLKAEDFTVFKELFEPSRAVWYKITSTHLKLTDGSYGFLHVLDDISVNKADEQKLKIDATTDPMTSALTRKAGFLILDDMIKHRHSRTNCAAFIDMDGLKQINDKFGHTEGDYAIRTIAEVISSCVRDTDTVIRYGGDEFLVLFRDRSESVARSAINRMYNKLEQINAESGKPFALAFSYGISDIEKSLSQASELIRKIDRLMYENKRVRNVGRPRAERDGAEQPTAERPGTEQLVSEQSGAE